MRDLMLVVVALLSACAAQSYGIEATPKEGDPKLVLVTLDGLRWQEVFRGADAELRPTKHTSNVTSMSPAPTSTSATAPLR